MSNFEDPIIQFKDLSIATIIYFIVNCLLVNNIIARLKKKNKQTNGKKLTCDIVNK